MPKLAPAAALPGDAETPANAPEDTIRAHLRAVWRYLRMQGAAPHEADDLAQEAFVVALQKGAAHLDPAATATFLRRTARFLFLRLRHAGLDAALLADAVDALWDRDCSADDGDGLLSALQSCLGQLTERSRHAVELSYGLGSFDRLGRHDLGKELGLEPNGVKTLMQRVRQQLRACIERRKP